MDNEDTALWFGSWKLPEKMEQVLSEQAEDIREIAKDFAGREDVFFIGRNLDYALSLEGSLKLKEISYIHSEAYASGELKHGTISLIEEGTPVIALKGGILFSKENIPLRTPKRKDEGPSPSTPRHWQFGA